MPSAASAAAPHVDAFAFDATYVRSIARALVSALPGTTYERSSTVPLTLRRGTALARENLLVRYFLWRGLANPFAYRLIPKTRGRAVPHRETAPTLASLSRHFIIATAPT